MRMIRTWKIGVAFPLVALVASCSQNQNAADNRVSDAQKAQQAGRDATEGPNSFERRSQDPAFNANTHYAAGRLAEIQGDNNRAIEHYWAALKLDPKHKDSLYRLGVVYTQLRHYPDATIAWKLYVKATDQSADAYSNLGFCYELAGKNSDAEDAYKKGISRDPKNNACRVNYGLLLARNGRVNEATLQFQQVLTPAQVHYNLASVYEFEGKPQEAKEEFRRAMAEDPNCVDAAVRLAELH